MLTVPPTVVIGMLFILNTPSPSISIPADSVPVSDHLNHFHRDTTLNHFFKEPLSLRKQGELLVISDAANFQYAFPRARYQSSHHHLVADSTGQLIAVFPHTDGRDSIVARIIAHACEEIQFDPPGKEIDQTRIMFDRGRGFFAFDKGRRDFLLPEEYNKHYEINEENYATSWKLIPSNKIDEVEAYAGEYNIRVDPTRVVLYSKPGIIHHFVFDKKRNRIRFHVSGTTTKEFTIYALYPVGKKFVLLGKLNIISCPPISKEVVLIPVNNTPIDTGQVRSTLQEIYGSIGVNWKVTKAGNLSYPGTMKLLTTATPGETFTNEMQNLLRYYGAQCAPFQLNTNYIFIMKASGAGRNGFRTVSGFSLPRKPFSFLFTSEFPERFVPVAIAQELGVSAFGLLHNYKGIYKKTWHARRTTNLMDYIGGKELWKWQWEIIRAAAESKGN